MKHSLLLLLIACTWQLNAQTNDHYALSVSVFGVLDGELGSTDGGPSSPSFYNTSTTVHLSKQLYGKDNFSFFGDLGVHFNRGDIYFFRGNNNWNVDVKSRSILLGGTVRQILGNGKRFRLSLGSSFCLSSEISRSGRQFEFDDFTGVREDTILAGTHRLQPMPLGRVFLGFHFQLPEGFIALEPYWGWQFFPYKNIDLVGKNLNEPILGLSVRYER